MENFIYRKATFDDLEELLSLGNLIADFNLSEISKPFWDYDVLKNCIENDDSGLIVCAFLEDNLIGFSIVLYNTIFKKGIIENTFVLPKCRNKGIAKNLFSFILKDAKQKDLETLSINTEFNNMSVINFFEKNGFDKSINNTELVLNIK